MLRDSSFVFMYARKTNTNFVPSETDPQK